MNDADGAPVTVQILEKDYLIACPPEERAALLESAALLNERLRSIRETGKVIGIERMVVMAALNMANDLARLKAKDHHLEVQVGTRVRHLRERVEKAVARSQQLEL
ncbi:MAG: cell division protein ZapA [Steroidobacteraceae bacterium]